MCGACPNCMKNFQAAAVGEDFICQLCGKDFCWPPSKAKTLLTAKFAKKTRKGRKEKLSEAVDHTAAHEEVMLAALADVDV
jgi:hypothetical protein